MSHSPSPGLHHVTAISGAPAENWRFYTETLGLRPVKKTVNFDDPGTYHLYYGDRIGQPGTALTFFAFADVAAGRDGAGEARQLTWHVPAGTLDAWAERLAAHDVSVSRGQRFERPRLMARDSHGFSFALIEGDTTGRQAWPDSTVPESEQIGAFAGIDIASCAPAATREVLESVLGYRAGPYNTHWQRYLAAGGSEHQAFIDLARQPTAQPAGSGRGSVHHIAFRARDSAHQAELAAAARGLGLNPTPVIDRQYFESVYFREPGGVLFEIATDGPGFTVDETEAELGTHLCLPPQYEPRRGVIEAELVPL